MITFFTGVSATLLVGILIWLIINIIKMLKKVKLLEQENQTQWREIEERYNSIERKIDLAIDLVERRIDDNYSYTDSRFDKLENKLTNKK
jgi:predicted Holliday junction resolvase-like endonuclease